jgi:hypothetical protein
MSACAARARQRWSEPQRALRETCVTPAPVSHNPIARNAFAQQRTSPMNVLVFGASRGTGRELVKQALAQGHVTTAFVRDPTKLEIKRDKLKIVRGDVANYESVERAVENQDAAICALGSATLLKRDPTLIEGVRHIIKAMEDARVQRFIYLSFLGVRGGRDQQRTTYRSVSERRAHRGDLHCPYNLACRHRGLHVEAVNRRCLSAQNTGRDELMKSFVTVA